MRLHTKLNDKVKIYRDSVLDEWIVKVNGVAAYHSNDKADAFQTGNLIVSEKVAATF